LNGFEKITDFVQRPAKERDPVQADEFVHFIHTELSDSQVFTRYSKKHFMNTFLAPIEKPKGFVMKLVYFFTKKQFGKVLTPLKVHSARLPIAFGLFYSKISQLDKKLRIPKETAMLIREQVARTNICLFCMDIGRYEVIRRSMNEAKFDNLEQYRTSGLFNESERVALDYVTELTRDKQVNPENFNRLSGHYTDREICEIVWLVASEHVYNMTNIGLNIHSDGLCQVAPKTN
jgi:alkylhydroperoxidase family enzyme